MKSLRALLLPLAVSGMVAAAFACNSGTDNCPPKQTVVPGASCSDDQLQCSYDLATPSAACDGTSTVIASSCVCTSGAWACPSPFGCDSGASPVGDASSSDDGASEAAAVDAGAGDAPVDSGLAGS